MDDLLSAQRHGHVPELGAAIECRVCGEEHCKRLAISAGAVVQQHLQKKEKGLYE
jgi:hypothetical protein